MSLLALIPARGGSKGIPRKNIRPFKGRPLIAWTIAAARLAKGIDRIVVSTEDAEIAEIAKSWGADVPFLRPAGLAEDTTPGMDVVFHTLAQLPEHDDILLLQPTSPLRQTEDIESIIALRERLAAPAAVSVSDIGHPPQWLYRIDDRSRLEPLLDMRPVGRRQEGGRAFMLNGALYLARTDWLRTHGSFISSDTVAYVMPPERSVDIDTPLDWHWAEFLMSRTNHA